jgi:hypothetical protein
MIFIYHNYSKDVKYVAQQVIYLLLGIPILVIFWLFIAIMIMSSIYFAIIVALILGFYAIIFVSSQQKWLNKYNRIITSIDFNNDYIKVNTGKILWKKAKTINIENTKIKFKKKSMYWWAKKGKDKTTYIFNVEGKEYYLIAEYFNDIDKVIEKLETIANN